MMCSSDFRRHRVPWRIDDLMPIFEYDDAVGDAVDLEDVVRDVDDQ